jgi:hypothetical protein
MPVCQVLEAKPLTLPACCRSTSTPVDLLFQMNRGYAVLVPFPNTGGKSLIKAFAPTQASTERLEKGAGETGRAGFW